VSEADLEMASIVQQKFFPLPDRKFRGWDIAVCYQPVSRVSGDMFDFYSTDGKLNGVSLFDVSGHGISASLITMLSKSIIYRAFQESLLKNLPVSHALKRINFHVNNEKGDIENYLTGLMFRFGDFDKNDSCPVKMSNAGHPRPIIYRRKEDKVSEISQTKDQKYYGAIGISGIEVSFPDIEYKMKSGDVLICFTDGLTETENFRREQFGSRRVAQVLWKNKEKSAEEILTALNKELNNFHPDSLMEDDLTIMVLKRIESAGYAEENSSLIEELPSL